MSKAHQVPALEGLFTWSNDEATLTGSKCISCNSYYFPRVWNCRNPECKEKKVEPATFSRQGKVYSYTWMHYPSPPPFNWEPFIPFGIVLVEMPEGIRILGRLTGCKLEDIKIGMDLELTIDKLYEDKQGNDVITYAFRPLKQSAGGKK